MNHPVPTLWSGFPSSEKEGKVLIYNNLTFSSSSEEEYSRLAGREMVNSLNILNFINR